MTARAVARRMAQCCRQLAERGLIAGQDGNLAVRLGPDRVLVTPSGVLKALLRPSDMVDVGAVVHAHPPVATGLGVAGQDMHTFVLPELILQCRGGVPLVPYGTPGTPELGDRIEPHLSGHDAWLLANHGAVTVGDTLDAAWIRMESLEHAARIIWTARTLGRVNELSPEAVGRLRRE